MKSYFNGTGELQAEYDRLWDKHVPASGEASTRHGEAIRAIGRFSYDIYNNGGGNVMNGYEDYEMSRFFADLADKLERFMYPKETNLYNRLRSICRSASEDWEHTAKLFEPIMTAVVLKVLEVEKEQELLQKTMKEFNRDWNKLNS
jgi:hypothetical protein